MTLREDVSGRNATFATAANRHELFIKITTEITASVLWKV